MQLSVIIVNYNVKYFLEQCLCSVIKACDDIQAEIFVVDNNSTDGSKEFFSGRFASVTFVWLAANSGFSKANNIGLQKATGKYVLFLNPDTIIPEDCLKKCIGVFGTDNSIGALGVHMIDGSGSFLRESKRGFPFPFTSLFKLSGLISLFPKSAVFAHYYLGNLDEKKNCEADVLAGAFMMIRKLITDKLGGFDEEFFMYGEDIDLSYRIQNAGYKNLYYAETTIIHFKGESTPQKTIQYVKLFYGAMALFIKKHYNKRLSGIYNMLIRFTIFLKTSVPRPGKKTRPLSREINSEYQPSHVLIIGNQYEYDKIKLVMEEKAAGRKLVGRIGPGLSIEDGTLGTIEQLGDSIKRHDVKEIVFCTTDFPVTQVVSTIQQLPAGINYWFYLAGSKSIVGSSTKDAPGIHIVVE